RIPVPEGRREWAALRARCDAAVRRRGDRARPARRRRRLRARMAGAVLAVSAGVASSGECGDSRSAYESVRCSRGVVLAPVVAQGIVAAIPFPVPIAPVVVAIAAVLSAAVGLAARARGIAGRRAVAAVMATRIGVAAATVAVIVRVGARVVA